ncbi:hypothetical protein [Tengunoibacter tsumagoiensis]|uniref:Uncharacterized protein n=1 Tax=Tengunoibacter tsumagoiensis TaxID=2014871 RepID=A0A402A452_9CHLR|nr:hypothetical protein [Tengunoibacter tsumagoiensis]GCE13923.1 hypothetical protein KTT_37820 [Tengunoibacter tsumagoiensis]
MNISTGGPHILLFERDQQLAALLISELQLAGYECHTARTAVEVFDAIARYSVQLVLVNLAQAATARREFWVALDGQRRDRKVQVFTFRCTNLAGYGPRDLDDHAQNTVADMEIDGMLGLMSLVDAVRARVPGTSSASGPLETISTMPRMQKMPTTSGPLPGVNLPPSSSSPRSQSPSSITPLGSSPANMLNSNTGYRTAVTAEGRMNTAPMPALPVNNQTTAFPPSFSPAAPPQEAQPTYTDKIRAVLYPNQRAWSNQTSATSFTHTQPEPASPPAAPIASQPASENTVLHRLAAGQINGDGSESSLAKLSRMAQGYHSNTLEPSTEAVAQNQVEPPQMRAPQAHYRSQPQTYQPAETPLKRSGNSGTNYQLSDEYHRPGVSQGGHAVQGGPAEINIPPAPIARVLPEHERQQAAPPAPVSYIVPTSAPLPRPVPANETISEQPLRASPIQGLPNERGGNAVSGTNLPNSESPRRPDVLTRTNYGQSTGQQPSAAMPPLASIATPPPVQGPAAQQNAQATPQPRTMPSSEAQSNTRRQEELRKETIQQQAQSGNGESGKEKSSYNWQDEIRLTRKQEEMLEGQMGANHALLLDIVQSFPAIADLPKQQEVQPQVLNGRATRSLGNVLLDGHLVPQDRLEVAQNIQRMLRGVDLNYQLGEILLMFKLLTPDQLLAASLVSFGLITTNQVSALGRIRQELHAIGLEYDLENLLILFRILTPEQLREVRASIQN